MLTEQGYRLAIYTDQTYALLGKGEQHHAPHNTRSHRPHTKHTKHTCVPPPPAPAVFVLICVVHFGVVVGFDATWGLVRPLWSSDARLQSSNALYWKTDATNNNNQRVMIGAQFNGNTHTAAHTKHAQHDHDKRELACMDICCCSQLRCVCVLSWLLRVVVCLMCVCVLCVCVSLTS